MDIELPNGKVIQGVPDGTPKEEIMRKAIAAGFATAEDFGNPSPEPAQPPGEQLARPLELNMRPKIDQQPQPQDYQQYGQRKAPYSYGTRQPASTQGFEPSESRETRATRELPELFDTDAGGFLSGSDPVTGAKVAAAILTTTNDQEVADILTANYPQIGIQYDKAGNIIAGNNETGQRVVINKPGASKTDLLQFLGLGSTMFPSGRAAKAASLSGRVGLEAAEAGVRSTVTQAGQSAVGGEFNEGDVLLDITTAGGAEFLPSVLKSLRERAGKKAVTAADDISGKADTEALTTQIADQAGAKKPDVDLIADPAIANRETLEAAKRLGIDEDLTPGQIGGSEAYREIEGSISAIPGTQLSAQRNEAIKKTAQTADDFIAEFGGSFDKAALSDEVRDGALRNIDNLKRSEKELYDQVGKAIEKRAKVDTSELAKFISKEAGDLGGIDRLDPQLKKLLDIATSKPTYALLDRERRAIGKALGDKLSKNAYSDSDEAALKKIYSVLTNVQEKAANKFGAGELWNAAKKITVNRKQLEDNSILLFGKEKAGAIMPKLGQAVKKLSKGDFDVFDKYMRSIPEEYRSQVVVTALNDAFTTGATRQQQLNPAGFADWFGKLSRNKSAKARLIKHLPQGAEKRMNDIYLVSKGVAEAEKSRIKTGVTQSTLNLLDGEKSILSKLYQFTKQAAVAEGVSSSAGLPGAGVTGVVASTLSRSKKDPIVKAADDLLASGPFKAATRNFVKSDERAIASRARFDKAITTSMEYNKWFKLLPSHTKQQIAKAGFMAWINEQNE